MLRHWDAVALPDLLERHGLTGIDEEPFPNDGWSGARLTMLRRGPDRFIVKRTSWATDWIARATRDHALREGFVAANPPSGTRSVVAPYHGAAADGTTLALLMPDLSDELIAWEGEVHGERLGVPTLARVIAATARLHRTPWAADPEGWPWCPPRERLLLLSRPSAERFRREGLEVGARFLAGWDAFDRLASSAARDLVDRLSREPEPLLAALERLPAVALHGDLKLANVALLEDERIALIDWQMTSRAPIAIELGWLLVSNVALLPEPPDAILERYREASVADGQASAGKAEEAPDVIGDWEAQVDLTWIVGLLLRGWRKGLDAESGTPTGDGRSGAEDLAWWCERAVAAADRRL